jgi:hypothetical protein
MKKKSKVFWFVIVLLTVIAVMEIFDLHPSISIGKTDITWTGFRHMSLLFSHGEETASVGAIGAKNGKLYRKCYMRFIGPVTIYRYEQPVA